MPEGSAETVGGGDLGQDLQQVLKPMRVRVYNVNVTYNHTYIS